MTERLNPGEEIRLNTPRDHLTSLNGRFTLQLQGDGNLVLYQDGHIPLWSSTTAGHTAEFAAMQGDGNFVLYGPGGVVLSGGSNANKVPTGTNGNPGAWIQLQDDGNLVIYKPGPVAIWNTDTRLVLPPPPLLVTMTANVTRGIAPLTVSFTAFANQPVARYSWDFGDHQGSAAQNQTHRYNVAGAYMAGVTAFTSDGRKASTHVPIIVTQPVTALPGPGDTRPWWIWVDFRIGDDRYFKYTTFGDAIDARNNFILHDDNVEEVKGPTQDTPPF